MTKNKAIVCSVVATSDARARIFAREGDVVRTAPHDESRVEDPSRIIYRCIRSLPGCHIVSNGDQTDTISEANRIIAIKRIPSVR